MINNLTEKDIMDYLMTSEFEEGLTPEEFKLLLFKFRNFYRVLNGRTDILKTDLDGKIREINEMKLSKQNTISLILSEKAIVENDYHILQNRKLSWEERLKGKIILTKDGKKNL